MAQVYQYQTRCYYSDRVGWLGIGSVENLQLCDIAAQLYEFVGNLLVPDHGMSHTAFSLKCKTLSIPLTFE